VHVSHCNMISRAAQVVLISSFTTDVWALHDNQCLIIGDIYRPQKHQEIMLARSVSALLNKLGLAPELATVAKPVGIGSIKLEDILDGFLWVQKRKRNIYTRWRLRYGSDNWKDGTKLWKPKNNITTCPDCGSFHEHHTICRECFNVVNEKTQTELDRLREGRNTRSWFEPNVAQVKNPSSGDGPKVVKQN
jgi:ribosomal protein L32